MDIAANDSMPGHLAAKARELSAETVLDSARAQATALSMKILIVHGEVPPSGYLKDGHDNVIRLLLLISRQGTAKTAVYEVLREDKLDSLVDELEENGGYRSSLINEDGLLVQGYQL